MSLPAWESAQCIITQLRESKNRSGAIFEDILRQKVATWLERLLLSRFIDAHDGQGMCGKDERNPPNNPILDLWVREIFLGAYHLFVEWLRKNRVVSRVSSTEEKGEMHRYFATLFPANITSSGPPLAADSLLGRALKTANEVFEPTYRCAPGLENDRDAHFVRVHYVARYHLGKAWGRFLNAESPYTSVLNNRHDKCKWWKHSVDIPHANTTLFASRSNDSHSSRSRETASIEEAVASTTIAASISTQFVLPFSLLGTCSPTCSVYLHPQDSACGGISLQSN